MRLDYDVERGEDVGGDDLQDDYFGEEEIYEDYFGEEESEEEEEEVVMKKGRRGKVLPRSVGELGMVVGEMTVEEEKKYIKGLGLAKSKATVELEEFFLAFLKRTMEFVGGLGEEEGEKKGEEGGRSLKFVGELGGSERGKFYVGVVSEFVEKHTLTAAKVFKQVLREVHQRVLAKQFRIFYLFFILLFFFYFNINVYIYSI